MASSGVRKFGFAVIGFGRMGYVHALNLVQSSRASVKWVVVRSDVNKAQHLSRRFELPPQCVTPTHLDQVLEDKSLDAVVVSSLTSQHETQIKAALDAGKAVFSEKPITSDVDSTKACYDLAESKGRPLLCGFHRRFDPSFQSVHAALRSGSAGRLKLLRFSSHDHLPPPLDYVKNSGGIIKDSTIHDLDLALWMSGSPAKRIYVQAKAFNPEVEKYSDYDLVVITIEHESGTVSVIDNGRRCAHGYDQRLEAICEDGSYIVNNRPTSQVHVHSTSSSVAPPIDQLFDTRYTDAYRNEVEHFLDVLEGAPPLVKKRDTLSVMELTEAAMMSIRTGQPVESPWRL